MHGTKRTYPGYLVMPGYRRQCICTDGCPYRECAVVEASRFLNYDFEWKRLPPNDAIDEAIRNKNERIREELRKQLRYELSLLKQQAKDSIWKLSM